MSGTTVGSGFPPVHRDTVAGIEHQMASPNAYAELEHELRQAGVLWDRIHLEARRIAGDDDALRLKIVQAVGRIVETVRQSYVVADLQAAFEAPEASTER
jgi:hypothetical protein